MFVRFRRCCVLGRRSCSCRRRCGPAGPVVRHPGRCRVRHPGRRCGIGSCRAGAAGRALVPSPSVPALPVLRPHLLGRGPARRALFRPLVLLVLPALVRAAGRGPASLFPGASFFLLWFSSSLSPSASAVRAVAALLPPRLSRTWSPRFARACSSPCSFPARPACPRSLGPLSLSPRCSLSAPAALPVLSARPCSPLGAPRLSVRWRLPRIRCGCVGPASAVRRSFAPPAIIPAAGAVPGPARGPSAPSRPAWASPCSCSCRQGCSRPRPGASGSRRPSAAGSCSQPSSSYSSRRGQALPRPAPPV